MIVKHRFGFFYVADDLGAPVSNGWFDRSKAEAAEDCDDAQEHPEADVSLDFFGNPENADDWLARVRWDHENDSEAFAEAFPKFLQDSPEEWDESVWSLATEPGTTIVWIPVAEARRLEAACQSIEGFEGGPDNAPTALLFYYPEAAHAEQA